MKDKNRNNKSTSGPAIGMCIGISVGTAIGASTHNIGLWLPVGMGVGMCLGLAFGHNDSGDDNDETKKWFHHTQMDGAHAGKFLMNLQNEINNIKSVTRRRK